MKKTAIAPANIAFIKYWGKKDDVLRLPLNPSVSMNLSGSVTTTTVEFSQSYPEDRVELVDGAFSREEIDRVVVALDRIRSRAGISLKARVATQNTFPKGAGAAASASGFAALTVAGFAAAAMSLSEKEFTVFARLGSGSACRSIPDGFVYWEEGNTSDESYAFSLHPHGYWDVRDALVIVESGMKKVSTTAGMESIRTSPLLPARLVAIPDRIDRVKKALAGKQFAALGAVIEEDCLDMHAVMQSQRPPINYWNDATVSIMDQIRAWRKGGVEAYFTIDAGPNVHVIYEGKNQETVLDHIRAVSGVQSVIVNSAAPGAHLTDAHLF